MDALVLSSVSKPNDHNSRGEGREFGLFWLAEGHAVRRLTERRCALSVLPKCHIMVLKSLMVSNKLKYLHMDATFLQSF